MPDKGLFHKLDEVFKRLDNIEPKVMSIKDENEHMSIKYNFEIAMEIVS